MYFVLCECFLCEINKNIINHYSSKIGSTWRTFYFNLTCSAVCVHLQYTSYLYSFQDSLNEVYMLRRVFLCVIVRANQEYNMYKNNVISWKFVKVFDCTYHTNYLRRYLQGSSSVTSLPIPNSYKFKQYIKKSDIQRN